jgi:hypothetical protein
MLLEARQQWLLQGRDVEELQQQELAGAGVAPERGQQLQGLAGGSSSSSSLQLARSVSVTSLSSTSSGRDVGAGQSAVPSSSSSLAAPATLSAPRSGRGLFGFFPFSKQVPATQNQQHHHQQQDMHNQEDGQQQQQQQQVLADMTCSDAGTTDDDAFTAALSAGAAAKVQPTSGAFDAMFGSDNRMGVPGSLHRISAMRNRQGAIYGLTYRCAACKCRVNLVQSFMLGACTRYSAFMASRTGAQTGYGVMVRAPLTCAGISHPVHITRHLTDENVSLSSSSSGSQSLVCEPL